MALTKVSRGLLSTGIVDNSNATAITLNADESATFAGAISVTGAATMGGLTVNPTASAEISGAVSGNYILKLDNTHATSGNGLRIETPSTSSGEFSLVVKSNNGSNNNLVVSNNGDISFYNAAGNSQALFWDASAESLGIGTSSINSFSGYTSLEINNAVNGSILDLSQGDTMRGRFIATASTMAIETSGSIPIVFQPAGAERMRIDGASGNITQTGANSADFLIKAPTDNASLTLQAGASDSGAEAAIINFLQNTTYKWQMGMDTDNGFRWYNYAASSEAMRIDTAGNLRIGQSAEDAPGASNTVAGVAIRGGTDNRSFFSVNSNYAMHLNRNTSDGSILEFARSGTGVGYVGIDSADLFVSFSQTNNIGIRSGVTGGIPVLFPCGNTGSARDNAASWGYANGRWKEIFAVNGSINTSDRNEKQDIAELTDAEQRVAVACKGLLRKFRWIDAVAEKGDDARIHFGIIAQDLQAAFEAEGLDAGRYAMFTSNTWWESQTEVAAVEATEDTEAVDAYTRTDTYDTAEEAPEGATERTRLGVRYSELLAFIIAAI